jgi:mRNA interferase YafQ
MKYEVEMSSKFKKDLRNARKRGYDIDKLDAVVYLLQNGIELPLKNRDHDLSGGYIGYRECHITPDWLLVYKHIDDKVALLATMSNV